MIGLTDLLDSAGIPWADESHKHGRPGWVQIDCPWCGTGTGAFHLGISLTTGACSCWRCGRHSSTEAIRLSARKKIPDLQGAWKSIAWRPRVALQAVKGTLVEPTGLVDLMPGHRAYIARRGLDPDEMVRLWGIRGIGQTGRLRWRIYIPIHHHGETVSWTTRAISKDAKMRYLSAAEKDEAWPHKKVLYGADYAHHAVIIHEGPIDVWATGPGAVATFGTAYTPAQLRQLASYPVRIVCFDSTADAQREAMRLAGLLAPFPGVTKNVCLESGKDAADADPGEIAELRKFLT